MWPLLLTDARAASVHASHHGVRVGDDIVWTTRFDSSEVPLADPGRVAAEIVDGGEVSDGTLRTGGLVHVHQRGHDGLHPPLAAGSGTQRVTVEGYAFTPDPALGLERHIDGWMRPDIERQERSAADHLGRAGSFPIYISVDSEVLAADGLAGSVTEAETTPLPVLLVFGGIFTAAILALETARRLLARQAKREARRAERERYVGGLGGGGAAGEESG